MRTMLMAALRASALLATTAMATEVQDRADLLKPAPNTAWNRFGVGKVETVEISPGLYSYSGSARNIFLVTKDGVIATDPLTAKDAKQMREEIRKITDKPVKYVVYSHNHWDHVSGGQIFKDEGAQFIAHEKCVQHFKDKPNPTVVIPDITFPKNYTVKLGERSLDLIYLGPNHSDCLVFMRADGEARKYLFAVDIATPGGAPLTFMAGYDPYNWVRTLKELEAMDFTVMIPGHGVPIADKSSLTERRRYLEALMAAVKKAVDEGMPPNEIPDKVRVPEFAYLRGYELNVRDNVRRMQAFYGIGE
ncbi:MAG: MBL fold metallo-hydrolase [Rhodospirillaceae bacterium]|nr:MBL fold metallo-hydrolase [Rhodospirillaceae bacterium]